MREAKFSRTGKIGVTGTRRDEFFFLRGELRFRGVFHGQEFFPVGPIAIFNAHSDGRANGLPVTHAGENVGAVFFYFLAAAASVAELAAVQFVIDNIDVNG
jgi:hypothetical protein